MKCDSHLLSRPMQTGKIFAMLILPFFFEPMWVCRSLRNKRYLRLLFSNMSANIIHIFRVNNQKQVLSVWKKLNIQGIKNELIKDDVQLDEHKTFFCRLLQMQPDSE